MSATAFTVLEYQRKVFMDMSAIYFCPKPGKARLWCCTSAVVYDSPSFHTSRLYLYIYVTGSEKRGHLRAICTIEIQTK